MARGIAVALVAVVALSAATARADGYYYSESVGGSKIRDQLGNVYDASLRIRLALGMRQGSWALEAWIAGDMPQATADGPVREYHDDSSLMQYGLDVKYLQPIADHFDVYLRGGVSHAQTDRFHDDLDGYAGRGLGVGAGVQLK